MWTSKNSIRLKSEVDLQLWKTQMTMWTSVGLWESIKENIKASATESLGYYELKHHKPKFDEQCLKLLDYRKQAELQWLQKPSQINADNLNNVRCKIRITFRNRKEHI